MTSDFRWPVDVTVDCKCVNVFHLTPRVTLGGRGEGTSPCLWADRTCIILHMLMEVKPLEPISQMFKTMATYLHLLRGHVMAPIPRLHAFTVEELPEVHWENFIRQDSERTLGILASRIIGRFMQGSSQTNDEEMLRKARCYSRRAPGRATPHAKLLR